MLRVAAARATWGRTSLLPRLPHVRAPDDVPAAPGANHPLQNADLLVKSHDVGPSPDADGDLQQLVKQAPELGRLLLQRRSIDRFQPRLFGDRCCSSVASSSLPGRLAHWLLELLERSSSGSEVALPLIIARAGRVAAHPASKVRLPADSAPPRHRRRTGSAPAKDSLVTSRGSGCG